jgi:hypothetical protein
MHMKYLITGLLIIAVTVQSVKAQSDTTEYNRRPFQFTFMFPPLSTNGAKNADYINNVSLNLFLGVSGGVENFEAGTFININKYDVKGVQLAGFGNTVGGYVSAAQLAGFYNVAGSGVKGAQVAGFINVSGDTLVGYQGAGFFNVAKEVKGAQLAGFFNIAGHVNGVQIAGFLNICDSINGVPLGFINVVKKNGYRKLTFSVSETQYANLAFKLGVRELYNIYSFGKPFGPVSRWMFGGGLGTELDLKEHMMLNIEGTVHQELWMGNPVNAHFLYMDRLNMYNTLKFLFGWNMENQVTLQVGPTFNVSVANINVNRGMLPWHEIPFYSVFDRTSPDMTNVQMWFGLQGSITF